MKKKGTGKNFVIVISAPSGSGKTTVCDQLMRRLKQKAVRSVSYTTRHARQGEKSGRDYHFVSPAVFTAKVRRGFFLEWARYSGHCYGTPQPPVKTALRAGRDVILEIDIQGARRIKKFFPKDCITIFIIPPSAAELKRRLIKRATNTHRDIVRRLHIACREIKEAQAYDYIVINDTVPAAVTRIEAIIAAERQRVYRAMPRVETFCRELQRAQRK